MFEHRTPFTTVDHATGEMTVTLGLQQLWSDAKLNRSPYYYLHVFYIINPNISHSSICRI